MKKKIFITVLSVIGIITTVKLAMIYYNANFNPYALSSFCSVNDFIDCDGIAKTSEAQFFGIPLAYWGMFLYFFILLMLCVDKLKNIKFLKFFEVFKNPMDYIASLGLISFIISMSLLCISLFEIKKLCILCAFTYLLNLLIGCIAVDFKNGGFVKSFKQSFTDFVDAVKIKKYLIAFIAVAVAACAFLTYTSVSYKFAPQVKKQKEIDQFRGENKYKVQGNVLGDEDAQVIVYAYSDYQCPICPVHNNMMHKLAKDLKNIKIVHKNLPLDMSCNPYLQSPFHYGSCIDAKYAVAAEKQGKFWEMNNMLFEKKPQTEVQILDLIQDMGLDIEKLKKDANSAETALKVKNDIDDAYKAKIIGTPSTVIDGKIYVGLKSYGEYVECLKKAGAKKR